MKIFTMNWNDIIPGIPGTIEADDLDDTVQAVILWQEVLGIEKQVAEACRNNGVPYFVAQHGVGGAGFTDYTEYGEHGGKVFSTGILAWSEASAELFVKDGADPKTVHVVGNPFPAQAHVGGGGVLFVPSHQEPSSHINRRNENEALMIWNELKVGGMNPTAKLLTGEHDPNLYPGPKIFSQRGEKGHMRRICNLLREIDCVVVQHESTFAFLAHRAGVPVVKVENKYDKVTDACVVSGISDICRAVRDSWENPNRLKEEREKVCKHFLGEDNVAGKNIYKILEEAIKK